MQYQTNAQEITPGDIFVCINNKDLSKAFDIAIKNGASKIIGEFKNPGYKMYKRVPNVQKYLKKMLIKQNKYLEANFKFIAIINSFNEENNILYTLLKKLKIKCAYLTSQLLCYHRKKEYFTNETLNYILLNRILNKLKNKDITHIIINITPDQIDLLQNIRFAHCIINDLNIIDKKEITTINNITKNTLGHIAICSDDKYFKKIKKRSNFITVGKTANYKISKYFRRSNYTIVNFEHQYNKYSLYTGTTNPYIIKTYLLSMIIATHLGHDLLDVIKTLNKFFYKKKIN